MTTTSFLAIHGVGIGTGETRKGFSDSLCRLTFPNKEEASLRWQECVWEDLNDNIDERISEVVSKLFQEYRLPLTCNSPKGWMRWMKCACAFVANLGLFTGANFVNQALDLGLDFVLYLDSHHGALIRDRLRTRIYEIARTSQDNNVVLVAHSLGSVIAYDVVAEAVLKGDPLPVKALITFGSPLAWTFELREADKKPECKYLSTGDIPWKNFYYPQDYVTLHKELPCERFTGVQNIQLKLPKNATKATSHCAYWKDEELASCIREFAANVQNKS